MVVARGMPGDPRLDEDLAGGPGDRGPPASRGNYYVYCPPGQGEIVFKSLFRTTIAAVAALVLANFAAGTASAEDKGVQATLKYSVETVQKAAADALTVIGCEIKKNDAGYVEGYRSHKIGVFVGSGGETVSVKVTAGSDGATNVDIRTKKSFVGMAGQKNWDQPVLDEMTKSLAATPAPEPAATSGS